MWFHMCFKWGKIQVVVNQKKKNIMKTFSTVWIGINVQIEITSNNQVLTWRGKGGQDSLKFIKKHSI